MRIKSLFYSEDVLYLDVSTHNAADLEIVETTFVNDNIPFKREELKQDERERRLIRYTLTGDAIERLARILGGGFRKDGVFIADRTKPKKGEKVFACRELSKGGSGRGCEEIPAQNFNVASMKCALIAQKKGWFGGVPKEGYCREDGGI